MPDLSMKWATGVAGIGAVFVIVGLAMFSINSTLLPGFGDTSIPAVVGAINPYTLTGTAFMLFYGGLVLASGLLAILVIKIRRHRNTRIVVSLENSFD